jgi:hypothetical protein
MRIVKGKRRIKEEKKMISVKVVEMKGGKYLVKLGEDQNMVDKIELTDIEDVLELVLEIREGSKSANQYFEMTWTMPKKEDRVEVEYKVISLPD